MDDRRLGVALICRLLQVAPSSYYAAKTRTPSARAERDEELIPLLVDLWETNYCVHGSASSEGYPADRDHDRLAYAHVLAEGQRRDFVNRLTNAEELAKASGHLD